MSGRGNIVENENIKNDHLQMENIEQKLMHLNI
jgi:hypothetical protein